MVRLGQNFLADPNLLDAIVREAGVSATDVVLEVGGGEGVLTELLAPLVAHLHVVELDERLRPGLEAIAAEHASIELHFGDALRLDLTTLNPAPSAMVANLPYAIATPLLIETIRDLPSIQTWTVMVQREIAERLRARIGTRAYGAPSAITQLSCEVRMVRAVNPAVFTPRPNVDSAVLRLRRTGPAPSAAVCSLIRDAFAHRRKTLPRSLELATKRRESEAEASGQPPPRPRSGEIRHLAIEAMKRAGQDPALRAEMLAPAQLAALATELLSESA